MRSESPPDRSRELAARILAARIRELAGKVCTVAREVVRGSKSETPDTLVLRMRRAPSTASDTSGRDSDPGVTSDKKSRPFPTPVRPAGPVRWHHNGRPSAVEPVQSLSEAVTGHGPKVAVPLDRSFAAPFREEAIRHVLPTY